MLTFHVLTVFLLCIGSALSANILLTAAFKGNSHWMMFKPVISALLERGHKITAITHFAFDTESPNYRQIIIEPTWDWSVFNQTGIFETATDNENTFYKILSIWVYGIATTGHTLSSPVVQEFIKNDRTKFDLVINEQFYQEALNMFAVKYDCPLIVIGTLDYFDHNDRAHGAMTPLSHVPHTLSYNSDNMNFYQRLENMIYSIVDGVGRKIYYLPKQTELAREAFAGLEKNGAPLPTVDELEKKISLHLMNSHLALSYPRPKMPGMVDIAGIHIKPEKPLPVDIQTFLDEADDGAIYMSFGSFLQASEMPPAKYKLFVDVFRKLKMRVIWKWETENAENVPSNVMMRKWLPQSDILAHKNLKLFISHGGVFGSQEAIYHGVPLVILPFFGDQHLNGQKMTQRGIAVMENIAMLTSVKLENAINKITQNQSYYENVKIISESFRTNQNGPLDSAIWWIEYILKFNGAPHLQSHARNLSTFCYLSLDIIFAIFGAFYVIYKLVQTLLDSCKTKDPEATTHKHKKN